MEERRGSHTGTSDKDSIDATQEETKGSSSSFLSASTSATTTQRTGRKSNGSKSDVTMATENNNNNNSSSSNNVNRQSGTLSEKIRDHYKNSPKGLKASRLSWLLFHFHTSSQLYMTLVYIVPYLLQDYGEMPQYYLKIFFCYLFAMSQANWWCSVLYKSDLPDVRDKPTLDQDDWFQRPPEAMKNAEVIESKIDRYGFEWKYCRPCNRYKPPRSHHCDMCKKCVLRRDHHCYFIGRCVGHYNQRYFVVLTFFGIVAPIICFPVTLTYLLSLQNASWWGDYFLPNTLLLFFYYRTVSWQFTLLTFQCYTWIVLFVWSGFYFTVQISLVTAGKTLVELAKKFDMKVTSTWTDNMRVVFGDYWFANFLFPAQIIFKQRHDGIHYENVKFFGKNEGAK